MVQATVHWLVIPAQAVIAYGGVAIGFTCLSVPSLSMPGIPALCRRNGVPLTVEVSWLYVWACARAGVLRSVCSNW